MAAAAPAAALAACSPHLPDERAVPPRLAPFISSAGTGDPAARHSGCVRLRPGAARHAEVALLGFSGGPLAEDGKRTARQAGSAFRNLLRPTAQGLRTGDALRSAGIAPPRAWRDGCRTPGNLEQLPPVFFIRRDGTPVPIHQPQGLQAAARDFTLDGEVGKAEVQRFCDAVCPE